MAAILGTTGVRPNQESDGKRAIKANVLARQHRLNARQTAALRFLLEHGRIAIQDYEKLCPESNRRSLQRDLKGLLEKRLLRESGSSPTDPNRGYEPGANLFPKEL